jgi:hypothetical protein
MLLPFFPYFALFHPVAYFEFIDGQSLLIKCYYLSVLIQVNKQSFDSFLQYMGAGTSSSVVG